MPHPNAQSLDLTQFEGVVYTLKYFKPGLCKATRFKHAGCLKGPSPRCKTIQLAPSSQETEEGFKNDSKLPQAVARARRVVMELGLCNDWKWFVTLTFDGAKQNRDGTTLDRYDFPALYEKFKQWHKDLCKKYGRKFPYLLIPEKHKDGAWHMHGFFNSDIDDLLVSFVELDETGYKMPSGKRLPRKLIRGDFYDWPAYRKRFGFCSFGEIRSEMGVSAYATKYITKSLVENKDQLGYHTYFHTRPLNTPERLGVYYGKNDVLDSALKNHYEHCSTGFFEYDSSLGIDPVLDMLEEQSYWHHLLRLIYSQDVAPKKIKPEVEAEIDEYYEATQLAIKGFAEKTVKNTVSKGSARL